MESIEESRPLAAAAGFSPATGVFRSLHLSPSHLIPTDPNLNIATFVLSHLHSSSSTPALIDSSSGLSLSRPHLRRSALSLASALRHAFSISPGDVVLLLSPNSLLYPSICLGILAAGATLTTANPLNTPQDLSNQAHDSRANLAISSPEEAHKLHGLAIPILLTAGGDGISVTAEELMAGEDDHDEFDLASVVQSDVAALLYSSGTTGVSKGVVLTHRNLIAIVQLLKWTVDAVAAEKDVFLAFLPMFHVYGLAFFVLGLPCVPTATTVVMQRFDLRAALSAVEKYQVSNIPAVPPVLLGMAKGVKDGSWDLSSLRRVGTGAAPLAAAVGREFRRRFPWVELRDGYGLTESCGAATFFVSGEEAVRRSGSVGRLLPEFEAMVVEAEGGAAAPPGGVGELWLRGPGVMRGYLGNEKATAAAMGGDGWLRTGDLVYFDADGYLYIVDRIKELIKHKGFQVAPAELEALLLSHKQILDAAVIPLEDEETGQVPMAYVVRSDGSKLTSEEVIQFVAAQVAPYKKIKNVAFISAIPRSAAGKILRKQLVALNQEPSISKL